MRLHALIGAALLAPAAGATFAWGPAPLADPPAAPSGPEMPVRAEVAAFQAQAEQACRCARTRPDEQGKKDCWAGFERAIARWPHGEQTSLCQFSLNGICFGDDHEVCVTKSWSGPVGGEGTICTAQELQTAEAVFTEALTPYEGDKRAEPPDQALRRTLAAFARNDRLASRQYEGGCGGG